MTITHLSKPEQLCRDCDPTQFEFETTVELEELADVVGQERAVEAIRFGIGIQHDGFNLFVLGPSGTGKRTTVTRFLGRKATTEPVPPDWCYVNNFETPHKPRALPLPPGRGVALAKDMDDLVEELRTTISAAFESEDYRTRRQEAEEESKERQEAAFKEIQKKAQEHDIALLRTPVGLAFAPMRDGEVISPDEFQKLPEEERKQAEEAISELQGQLQDTAFQVRQWEREAREKVKELDRQVGMFAVGHLIDELREKHAELPRVVEYLDAVQKDVIENLDGFRKPRETSQDGVANWPRPVEGSPLFRRYQVDVLVDHSQSEGAPVIYEDNPTYNNLVGRIEHIAQMGALLTDFTLIKPGAFHLANGGYLILEARQLLLQPYAWDGLKRALRSQEINIAPLGQALSLISTISLEPEPIPLDIKFILVGDRRLYYRLYQLDPDFGELFKVAADFSENIERTPENNLLYARLIGTIAHNEGLLPFDRSAVARIIKRSSRLARDSEKLSVHLLSIADLMREADYWARASEREAASADDVQRAINAQIHRADRVRERVQERIEQGTVLIDTSGQHVGQVNALSVTGLGSFAFGQPSRVTARTRMGKGTVIDIEREVEMGGPIHSKGVLILSSFLGARYAPDHPLSLSASLVFEQSYGGIEGDSASMAELCTLLSALADAPINQSFAITGSVNQHGRAQPIGGVNEKIEGFFDVCKLRGLTGDQGVIIPATNTRSLMLRPDVIDAVYAGEFHIYAMDTVSDAIELLTGLPAGERREDDTFPEGSINRRVEAQLIRFAEKQRDFAAPPTDGEEEQERKAT